MGIMTSDRIRHLQAMNNPAMATSMYPPVPVQEEVPPPPMPQGQPVQFEPFPIDRIAEAQDMPNYAPARGAGANRSAIQSQRAFNADGSNRQSATWDELAEWNKSDAVAGRKDPRSTLAWSKYGNSPEEAVEFLKKKMSADMGIEYESSPEEAPLPGEETLPPEVAAQNHRRARAGAGVGELKGLEGMPLADRLAAMKDGVVKQGEINVSRQRQQEATDRRHGNFERLMLGQSDAERHQQILDRKPANPAPLPSDDPVQDLFDRQNADAKAYLAKHGILPEEAAYVDWVPNPNGAINPKTGKPEMIVNRDANGKAIKRHDAAYMKARRKQTERDFYVKNAEAIGKDKSLGEKFMANYDDGQDKFREHIAATVPNNDLHVGDEAIAHAGGLRLLEFDSRAEAKKQAQRQVNVNRRQEQIEMTRAMQDPRRGPAMFAQRLASANTPQEVMNTLMLAHYHQPQMGWGQAAMMIYRGEMDARALSQWAQMQTAMQQPPKPTGPDAVALDLERALSNMNDGTVPALMQIAAQANQGAKPEVVQQWITRSLLPKVQGILSQRRPLTIHEKALVRLVIPNPRYLREFAQATGIPETDPQIAALFQDVYGTAPTFAYGRWAWDQGAAALEGIAEWFGGDDKKGQAQAAGK